MLINLDHYQCPLCKTRYDFDTSKPFSAKCPSCQTEMEFIWNHNEDSIELRRRRAREERRKWEESSKIKCPYCNSTDTKKITATSRSLSIVAFGLGSKKLGKQFHCNKCKADF